MKKRKKRRKVKGRPDRPPPIPDLGKLTDRDWLAVEASLKEFALKFDVLPNLDYFADSVGRLGVSFGDLSIAASGALVNGFEMVSGGVYQCQIKRDWNVMKKTGKDRDQVDRHHFGKFAEFGDFSRFALRKQDVVFGAKLDSFLKNSHTVLWREAKKPSQKMGYSVLLDRKLDRVSDSVKYLYTFAKFEFSEGDVALHPLAECPAVIARIVPLAPIWEDDKAYDFRVLFAFLHFSDETAMAENRLLIDSVLFELDHSWLLTPVLYRPPSEYGWGNNGNA